MILAAATAAALSACTGDDETPDDMGGAGGAATDASDSGGSPLDGDTGGNGNDGSGATSAGGTGGGNTGGSTSGGGTGGITADGGTSSGGTGEGGEGGEALGGMGGEIVLPPTVEEIVAAECPLPDYTIVEGTRIGDSYEGEILDSPPEAYALLNGDDYLEVLGGTACTTEQSCVVGGAGDDTLEFGGSSWSEGSIWYGTSCPFVHFVGEDGADVIEYRVESTSAYTHDRPIFTFRDFEPNIDLLVLGHAENLLDGADAASATPPIVIPNFEASTSAETGTCTNWYVVLDPTDGEVWLTCDTYNELIGTLGDGTQEASTDDIVIVD